MLLSFMLPSLILFASQSVLAAGEPTLRYEPSLVSAPAGAIQEMGPGLAVDRRGNYVTVWSEQATGPTTFEVRARRMSFDGTPLGASFVVNEPGLQYSLWPSVASDAKGGFVVTWAYDAGGGTTNLVIKARRYDAAGKVLSDVRQITAVGALSDSAPRIAMNAAGDHVIAWSRKGSPSQDVARVFDAAGTPLGPEFELPLLQGDMPDIGLGLTGDRRVVVSGASPINNNFRVQCFNATGTPASTAQQYSINGSSIIPPDPGSLVVAPDDRSYMAFVKREFHPFNTSQIALVGLAADCSQFEWSVLLDALPGNIAGYVSPNVALSKPDGAVLLSWTMVSAIGGGYSAQMRRYDRIDGTTLSDVSQLVPERTSLRTPQLAPRTHGFSAVWTQSDSANASDFEDVFGSGYFTAIAPAAGLSHYELDFANQAAASTSAPRSITVNNDGNAPLTINGATVTGDFAIRSNTCTTVLAPGASCNIAVTFSPGDIGARSGSLSIRSDSSTSPDLVALSGNAVGDGGGDGGGGGGGGGGGALPWPLLLVILSFALLRKRRPVAGPYSAS